ncbi:alpha/beta fold hydrolase [Nocardioides sp. AX2bis]|uniref:alpha/beta fold hydrolase n=1 Tax=Nocardioides sp. AX2bis TaxID=2653157 RepID=UPI0012F1D9AF|nr:alpha/beta fold hydrolase [Nocardioides sp. AX2bis]VXC25682.1 conserved hypothetical protein [Nocardioides sp. AX2bis]
MAVLITPGAFTRASSFARLAERLDAKVVELPIRARRLPQLDRGGLAANDAALLAAIDEVQDDERPLVLVGHSMGGLLALRAGQHRRIDAQVLLMPAPPDGLLGDMTRLTLSDPVTALKYAMLSVSTVPARFWWLAPPRGLFTPEATPEALADTRRHRADESLLTLLQLLIGSREPVRPAGVPTLVVGGTGDGLVPASTTRRLAEQLGADYLELPVGHNFSEEPAGEVVEVEVERWLGTQGLLTTTVPRSSPIPRLT